jgi:amino acid adenylation domain-containing protein
VSRSAQRAWLVGADGPPAQPIERLLRRWARRTPEAAAVVGDSGRWTYRDLDRRADRWARVLRRHGVRPGSVVGVLMPRAPEIVAVLTGIWRAGCAYLPLDPDAPPRRQRAVLRTAGAVAVVGAADGLGLPVLTGHDEANTEADGTLDVPVAPDDLACVLFTSGTSGVPKGVLITHRAIHRLVYGVPQLDDLGPGDVVLHLAPLAFDASLFEIWTPLARGACVAVAPAGLLGPEELGEVIARHRVGTAWLTASLANAVITAAPLALRPLRTLLTGGEPLSPVHVAAAHRHLPGLDVVNCYGPTESTTFATSFTTTGRQRADTPNVPIGTPLRGTDVAIVHDDGTLAEVGEVGEIWIGGAGLAQGYCGDPELTERRFVPHPAMSGRRAYRTGDLGRLLADGNLDILGRRDDQVKINGHRIEPREVEAVLLACPEVSAGVVVVRERRLIAYVVGSPDHARQYLMERLPSWLLPAACLQIDKVPLTATGKLDTALLPVPEPATGRPYVSPVTADERLLATIVEEVLNQAPLSVRDDFFALGGDSFLAMRVASRARAAGFGFRTQLLFDHPTVAGLAQAARDEHNAPSARPGGQGRIGDIPIMRWFLRNVPGHRRNHYNQALLLSLPDDLDRDALRLALHAVVSHHQGLRLRVADDAIVVDDDPPRDDLLLEPATSHTLHTSLDLRRGPLLRAGITDAGLLLAVHRLAVDSASWPVIIDDLNSAYRQAVRQRAITLPGNGSTLADWAMRLAEYARGDAVRAQRTHWHRRIPAATDQPTGTIAEGRTVSLPLPGEDTERWTRLLARHRIAIQDAVLAIAAVALCDWRSSQEVLMTVEDHGRAAELFEGVDLTRTVGWLALRYPVRLPMGGHTSWPARLEEVRRARAHDRGLGYELLGLPQSTAVGFGYFGRAVESLLTADEPASVPFRLAAGVTGQEVDPAIARSYRLYIGALLTGDGLAFTVEYAPALDPHHTVERLCTALSQSFDSLLRHLEAGG